MTKDKIVSSLIKQMADRSNQGIIKYNNTIDKAKMNPVQAIENAIEEALDLAVYLAKAKYELQQQEENKILNESYGGTI
tara:strand:- start:3479 stop:3715 length:237 start_codon:yes stop_codon:yes gene_type:complete